MTCTDVKATKCKMPEVEAQKEVTSMHKPDTEIQDYFMKPKSDDTVVSQQTVGAVNRTSDRKKNHCVKPKYLSPAASIAFTPRCKPVSFGQIRPITAASVNVSTKGPVKSALLKTRMNYKSDITKYMIKTQKVTLMIP